MTPTTRRWGEIGGALAIGGVFTFVTLRNGRTLTFDGYHYCELAKQFAVSLPDRFGNHWPFGWPLAGGLLARLGVPAYEALVALSFLALAILLTCSAVMLGQHSLRWAVLAALATTPVVAPQIGNVLTELPLATALVGLALCLSRWPGRGALWGTALCCVIALSLRYAGLIALSIFAVFGLANWQALRTARRLGEALAAIFSAAVVCGLLLGLNWLRTGEISGAGRGPSAGLGALPMQLADFGWSVPSALIAGGLRDRLGAGTPIGLAVGGLTTLAIIVLCVLAWCRPRSGYSRPLAVTASSYWIGMAVLRCVGEFDSLHNARTFLPALAPLLLLMVERLAGRPAVTIAICASLLCTGGVAAARGISREVGGDVRAAVDVLRGRVAPTDVIAINDDAFALSAHFSQRTRRVWVRWWSEETPVRFLVVVAKPHRRDGSDPAFTENWPALCERLVHSGHYRYLTTTPAMIVLERITP